LRGIKDLKTCSLRSQIDEKLLIRNFGDNIDEELLDNNHLGDNRFNELSDDEKLLM